MSKLFSLSALLFLAMAFSSCEAPQETKEAESALGEKAGMTGQEAVSFIVGDEMNNCRLNPDFSDVFKMDKYLIGWVKEDFVFTVFYFLHVLVLHFVLGIILLVPTAEVMLC